MMTALVWLWTQTAAGGPYYTIQFCVKFQTNFEDTARLEDYWTDPTADRTGRGVWLEVKNTTTGAYAIQGYVSDVTGCASPVSLDAEIPWNVSTKSKARVNNVVIGSYSTVAARHSDVPNQIFHMLGFQPTADGVSNLHLPSSNLYHNLAVGTWAMHRSNLGLDHLGSSQQVECTITPPGLSTVSRVPDIAFAVVNEMNGDGGAHNAFDTIVMNTDRKFTIGHELGHFVGYRREAFEINNTSCGAYFLADFTAPINGCNGEGNTNTAKSLTQKEYSAGAAREGWANFYSAYLWNDPDDSDCFYDILSGSDFDLDRTFDFDEFNPNGYTSFDDNWEYEVWGVSGADAGWNGLFSCNGLPLVPTEPMPADPLRSYFLNDRDWLSQMIILSTYTGCTAPLANRAVELDWLRFWWDLVSTEQVSIVDVVDILDAMDAWNWRVLDTGAGDLPAERIEDAVLGELCAGQPTCDIWERQRGNGVDH